MIARNLLCCVTVAIIAVPITSVAADPADVERGAKYFQACMACHSLEAGQHMTGPSLAAIWARKAGSVVGFARYSDALKRSNVIWNENTLDAFLTNPAAFIPNNWMPFRGIEEKQPRQDLIAFLKSISEGKAPKTTAGGMMGSPNLPDLRNISAEARVAAISYCGDSYFVTSATGRKMAFWEFNLRFKTDSTARGPAPNQPVIVPAGMMGDRAHVVFSDPAEISTFIKPKCP